MNEKIFGIVGIVVIWVFAATCSGCTSRPVVVATDDAIIGSQISAARLEEINGNIRDVLQRYEDRIGSTSGQAIRGIDDALDALDRYDEFVQECIRSLRELEFETRPGNTEKDVLDEAILYRNNPFLD